MLVRPGINLMLLVLDTCAGRVGLGSNGGAHEHLLAVPLGLAF